jgi:hypothetical protein
VVLFSRGENDQFGGSFHERKRLVGDERLPEIVAADDDRFTHTATFLYQSRFFQQANNTVQSSKNRSSRGWSVAAPGWAVFFGWPGGP